MEIEGLELENNDELIKNHQPELTVQARPFVKWVGGKRSILQELIKRIPHNFDAYHELFLGGGALFFALQPKEAYISDVNFKLVITYRAIRDNLEDVINALKIHASNHNQEYYQNARKMFMKEKKFVNIAALFIYLNKTCFNGLYRVNRAGGFNVPMGDYKAPQILDEDNLLACSTILKGIEIKQNDFSNYKATKGDFYYLDPPYHKTYESYASGGFGDKEHVKLAEFCKKIDKKESYFMLSNSDTPFIRNLYKGYNIENVHASRSVSCKPHQRGKESELIIRNY